MWLLKSRGEGSFVIDLGSSRTVTCICIKNTRNGPYKDRGTCNYTVYACESVEALKDDRCAEFTAQG